uniref:Uncharacterized protein n=1 Tax=Arundo donax TaxID=35708 RepID=A0A0A9BC60_ARUDO
MKRGKLFLFLYNVVAMQIYLVTMFYCSIFVPGR